MLILRKYVTLFILLAFAALGISFTMKAAVGLAAFDAFNQTFAYILNARVGDIATIIQIIFVVLQLILLGKKANFRIILQIPLAAVLGQFINLFFYGLLGNIEIEGYVLRLLVFIIAQAIIPFFMGAIMVLDVVTMPVESLSMAISNKINTPFGPTRQGLDVAFIAISLVLTFVFSTPLTIREGTVLGALMFGPLLSFYMPKIEVYFKKWNLIEDKALI